MPRRVIEQEDGGGFEFRFSWPEKLIEIIPTTLERSRIAVAVLPPCSRRVTLIISAGHTFPRG